MTSEESTVKVIDAGATNLAMSVVMLGGWLWERHADIQRDIEQAVARIPTEVKDEKVMQEVQFLHQVVLGTYCALREVREQVEQMNERLVKFESEGRGL